MNAPIDLPQARAAWFPISRLRQDCLKRIARDRRDDPNFPWRKLAAFLANEARFLPPGLYFVKGLRGAQTWYGAHVASILYWGKNPIFDDDETAPPWIVAEVRAGIADAPPNKPHIRRTACDFAKGLGVSAADRERLAAWLVGAVDRNEDQLRDDAMARKRDRDRKCAAKRRLVKGAKPRQQYEAGSIAARSREMGISPATLRKRLSRQKSKAFEHVTCPSSLNKDSYNWTGDAPVTFDGGARLSATPLATAPPIMDRAKILSPDLNAADPESIIMRNASIRAQPKANRSAPPNPSAQEKPMDSNLNRPPAADSEIIRRAYEAMPVIEAAYREAMPDLCEEKLQHMLDFAVVVAASRIRVGLPPTNLHRRT